jgi:predicted nucleotidyltransferase
MTLRITDLKSKSAWLGACAFLCLARGGVGGLYIGMIHPAAKLAEDRLRWHVQRQLPCAQVWLFGSRAVNAARRRSDFDLAVRLGAESAETALEDFEDAVAADTEIIYPVDIVDLNTASSALQAAVERDGILWES